MTRINGLIPAALAAFAALGALSWDEGAGRPMSQAEARMGRPFTPMSYAGVARRTTRRAVAVGAAGAAATGAYYSSQPTCPQVVDAYGRIYSQC